VSDNLFGVSGWGGQLPSGLRRREATPPTASDLLALNKELHDLHVENEALKVALQLLQREHDMLQFNDGVPRAINELQNEVKAMNENFNELQNKIASWPEREKKQDKKPVTKCYCGKSATLFLRVPPDLKARLMELAFQRKQTANYLATTIISEYLDELSR